MSQRILKIRPSVLKPSEKVKEINTHSNVGKTHSLFVIRITLLSYFEKPS